MKKFYELKKWDLALHSGNLLIFQKIDGGYAQWLDEQWEIQIWHSREYEQWEDWVYMPKL